MILIAALEDLSILIIYLFALIEAFLADLIRLLPAGFDALVVLLCEFEVDLHTFLSL